MAADFEGARAAAAMAEAMLWATEPFIQSVNYCYFCALTIAAGYPVGRALNEGEVPKALRQHLNQLKEWADACPETFADKHVLVSAEIARLEGRGSTRNACTKRRSARPRARVHSKRSPCQRTCRAIPCGTRL